jgi:hypothetical protein
MKEYLMKFNEKGKPTFLDEKDRAAYRLLLSSIKKSNDIFVMKIEIYQGGRATGKQKQLYNVLIDMIAKYSGNDTSTIEETLLSNFKKEKITFNDFNNEIFNEFIEWTIVFCNDFFDLNININEQGNLEIKKVR